MRADYSTVVLALTRAEARNGALMRPVGSTIESVRAKEL
jgi:hypothetical protein